MGFLRSPPTIEYDDLRAASLSLLLLNLVPPEVLTRDIQAQMNAGASCASLLTSIAPL